MKRRIGPLAVVGLLLGAPAALAAPSAPRLTAPVNATKADTDVTRTYTSPSIAIDPERPSTMVMGFVEARTRRCGLLRSIDSGQSWTKLDSSPSPAAFPICFVISGSVNYTPIAFGRNHTLYYGLTGYDDTDGGVNNGNLSVLVARSTDLGDHWQTAVAQLNRGKVAPDTVSARPTSDLAVDTSGKEDVVYVTWRAEYRTSVAPNQQPRQPLVAVSRDGGKTFGEPVNPAAPAWANPQTRADALKTVTTLPGSPTTTAPPAGSRAAQPDQAANFGGSNPSLTVDDKGNVYVAWVSHSSNITPAPLPSVWVSASSDGGKTWTPHAVTPFQRGLNGFGTERIRWSPGGGPQGTLHVVYEGTTKPEVAGDTDAFYTRSTDGGNTWSTPRPLNDDGVDAFRAQNTPNLTVSPNGRIDVAWFDTRNDPGIRAQDVYMTSSTDNGVTWSKNVRVTDRIIDRRIGIWGNGYDQSSPPGIASTDKFLVVSWDDTRNFDAVTQGQDLFTTEMQLATLGGGTSKAVKIVVAGFVGLVAVGLMLLLVALVTRNRSGPGQPARQPVVSRA